MARPTPPTRTPTLFPHFRWELVWWTRVVLQQGTMFLALLGGEGCWLQESGELFFFLSGLQDERAIL